MNLPRYSDVPGGIFDKFMVKFNPDRPDLALGDILSKLLLYAIVLAGLFFFVRLIVSGFAYLTSAGDSGKIQSASKNLVNAAIGLLVVVCAYFIAQIIQQVFGINIL